MAAVGSGVGVAIVAVGALLTTFNEGLSDLLGVSRVAFAMGREADLPRSLAYLGRGQNPWRSVLFVGAIAILVAGFAPFGIAVAVSSFGTLLYYTVTNLSALRLPSQQRTFPRFLAWAGSGRLSWFSLDSRPSRHRHRTCNSSRRHNHSKFKAGGHEENQAKVRT